MIGNVKQAVINKLAELYPIHTYTIYDEDIPQNFKRPSFYITLTDQDYNKRLNNKSKSLISFDVAYFSDKSTTEIKADCLNVGLNLLREFDLIETYRVVSKQTMISDNVLHFTFNIIYSEIKVETVIPMLTQDTNTNL